MLAKKEWHEAQTTVVKTLEAIGNCLSDAKVIKGWSWFDLLGGDMLISWAKRKQIRSLNQRLADLREKVQAAKQELADVDLDLVTDLSDGEYEIIWDVWLDNPITDFRIHQEIGNLVDRLEKLEEHLLGHLDTIDQAM